MGRQDKVAAILGAFAVVALVAAAVGAAHAPNVADLKGLVDGTVEEPRPESSFTYLFIFPSFLLLGFFGMRTMDAEARQNVSRTPLGFLLTLVFAAGFLGATLYRVVRVFETF